jgi:hypothetical protein
MVLLFLLPGTLALADITDDPKVAACVQKMKKMNWQANYPYRDEQTSVTVQGDELHISGKINADTMEQYKGLKLTGVKTVVLNSTGGNIEIGKKFAELIEAKGWNTKVDHNGMCWSICTGMFQYGKVRTMDPSSLLGYHNAKVETGLGPMADNIASKTATGMGIAYLEAHELSPRLRDDIMNTPSNTIFCVDPDEAYKYNAANQRSAAPVVAAPAAPAPVRDMLEGVSTKPGVQVVH